MPADRDVDGRENRKTDKDQTAPTAASTRPTANDVTEGSATASQDAIGTAPPEPTANDATDGSKAANQDGIGTEAPAPTVTDVPDSSTAKNQDDIGTAPPEPTANGATDGSATANQDTTGKARSQPTAIDATDGSKTANHDYHGKKERTSSSRRGKSHLASSKTKRVLKAGRKLVGPLISSDEESAAWPSERGFILFAKKPSKDKSSLVSGEDKQPGLARPSVMVATDPGRLKSVLQARAEVRKEQRDGTLPTARANGGRIAWGWVPLLRTRHQKLVETARRHLGEVEMTLDVRGCVEVTVDGTCVLSKSGRFKREWMNRFPWRRSKNQDYQLHVKGDRMEVCLEGKTVWGVTANNDIMG